MTRNEFEQSLNEGLAKVKLEKLEKDYSYLSSERVVRKNALNGTMGTLIRRKDDILFETEYQTALRKVNGRENAN